MSTRGHFSSSVHPKDIDPSGHDQCIVSGVEALVLRISSFYGIAPLRFKPHRKGYGVSFSKYVRIYSYFLFVFAIITSFIGAADKFIVDLRQMASNIDYVFLVIMAVTGVYGAPDRMKSMLRCMDTIASISKRIGVQHYTARERKLKAAVIFFLLFYNFLIAYQIICFFILSQSAYFSQIWHEIFTFIGLYLLGSMAIVLEIQYTVITLAVQVRYKALNEALSLCARHVSVQSTLEARGLNQLNAFMTKDTSPESDQSEEASAIVGESATGELRILVSPSEALRRVGSCHATLSDVLHNINDNYTIAVLVILVSTLWYLIVSAFYTITDNNVLEFKNENFMTVHYLWILLRLLRLFMVVEPSHYIDVEESQTKTLVGNMLLVVPPSGPVAAQLEVFSRQLMVQTVSFEPFGLCTVGRPLLASIFGVVLTYSVVLIQSQGLEKDAVEKPH